jgi:hypothetical protein
MHTPSSVYIFQIGLDIYISFIIFALYIYILFRYYIHSFETIGLLKFFNIHLQFYKPLLKLYKVSDYNLKNPNSFNNYINEQLNDVNEKFIPIDYTIANWTLISFTCGLFLLLLIYFIIFREPILKVFKWTRILTTFIINAILILAFELLFLFYVYGNIDLFNIGKLLNY